MKTPNPRGSLRFFAWLAVTVLFLACGPSDQPSDQTPDQPEAQNAAESAQDPSSESDSSGTKPSWPPIVPELTAEERAAYGNRVDFFAMIPTQYRADLDWRSALGPKLADEHPEWSQGFEELIIRDFFKDSGPGIFLDVGCYLPQKLSTTYYLESKLGWDGIAIDVIEAYAEPWSRLRPEATFVHAAVSDTDGEVLELHLAGSIATLEREVIDDLGLGERAKTITVETTTLDTLLEEQGIEKIDFLSMDIEGAELAALRGFDIKRFNPELCVIETAHRDEVTAFFETNGYELIEKYLKVDKINLYYQRKPAE